MQIKDIKQNKLFFSVIFIILSIAVLMRVYMWIFHFGTCDDLGVAVTTLYGENGDGAIRDLIKGFKSFLRFGWTYAPLQFSITTLLLNLKESYQQIVILGRLPSFVFSIGTIFLGVFLGLRILSKNNDNSLFSKSIFILGLLLVSFSFENILFAGQMECYAVAPFGSVIILLLFYKNKNGFWLWNWIFLAALCCLQWQFFIIVFAFFAVYFCEAFISKKSWIKDVMLQAETVFILNIPNLYIFLRGGMINRGAIVWNVGPNMEYLFHLDETKGSLFSIIKYIFSFFCINIIKIYKILFIPLKYTGFFSTVFAVLLVILTILGLLWLHKQNQYKIFAYFSDTIIVLTITLILFKKLTFGPSRHMLVYQPFIIVWILCGILYIGLIFNSKRIINGLIIGFSSLLFVAFLAEIPEQLIIRKNRYSPKEFNSVIKKYNPDIIITYGYMATMNTFLTEISGYDKVIERSAHEQFLIKKDIDSSKKIKLLTYNGDLEDGEVKTIIDKAIESVYGDDFIFMEYPDFKLKVIENDSWLGADQEYCFTDRKLEMSRIIRVYESE